MITSLLVVMVVVGIIQLAQCVINASMTIVMLKMINDDKKSKRNLTMKEESRHEFK